MESAQSDGCVSVGDTNVGKSPSSATAPQVCVDDRWEQAYLRFETPAEEIRKFMGRLVELGASEWPRGAQIVELFCGRGNGLRALERLGFTDVEGVDLSAHLLAEYTGKARCFVGDCRRLQFDTRSKDIIIVQGGLHHLPTLPEDLERTLNEIHRVLRERGLVVIVEPWLTPFLFFVHAVSRVRLARMISKKIDAFETMFILERPTYEAWLGQPQEIRRVLDRLFEPVTAKTSWGKLRYVGRRRSDA